MIRILMTMRNHLANLYRGMLLLVFSVVLVTPDVVWAQAAPAPNVRNSPKVWIGLMTILLLLVVVVAVSLMPSKRGHQD